MINLKCGALLFVLCLFALGVRANEGIQGAWFRVPDGAQSAVENAEYIMVMKEDGQLVEIFIDPSGRMEVFPGGRFEVAGEVLTLVFADRDPSHYRFRLASEDNLILSLNDARSMELHALTGQGGVWASAVKFAESGDVRSIQILTSDGGNILGAPEAARVYLDASQGPDAAKGSILLLAFSGSRSGGTVSRGGNDWLAPISPDAIALAVGPESFLPRFEQLVRRISSRSGLSSGDL